MYGICNLSMIPVRAEPSDRSEMVSQLLFGESFQIMENKDSWLKVKLQFDDYTGWIDKKQIAHLDENEFKKNASVQTTVTLDIVQIVIFGQSNIIPVILGSTLPD